MDDNLQFGYRAGVWMAGDSMLLAGIYLFTFLFESNDLPPNQNQLDVLQMHLVAVTTHNRMLLQSTAVFVGMAFGFLGFALFLIGAKGSSDVKAKLGDRQISLTNLAPGLVVILCATTIIMFAVWKPINFEISPADTRPTTPPADARASETPY